MAYNSHNLSVLAYANGFTLWHYSTVDSPSSVDTLGYFNDAAEMLRTGDMVMANCDIDGTQSGGIFLVARSAGGVVDTTNLTSIGTSNTD